MLQNWFFRHLQIIGEASRALPEGVRRNERRGTQELCEFYLLERFLYRLSVSWYRDRFVLKGGLLLRILGVRRPTRDADVLARNIASNDDALLAVVKEEATISAPLLTQLPRVTVLVVKVD